MPEQINMNENLISKKVIILISEAFSKIYKSISYKKVILDQIHSFQWKNTIKEKLHNLKSYHI